LGGFLIGYTAVEAESRERNVDMIYIKSILVGILTLVAATIVYVVAVVFVLMRSYQPPPSGEVSINLAAVLMRPLFLLIAAAAFAVGFYWEFRRIRP
jgi:hypothetical protein